MSELHASFIIRSFPAYQSGMARDLVELISSKDPCHGTDESKEQARDRVSQSAVLG